jgi:hypothetical protein
MSVESHEGVHRHPAPTGFIRKYIFSVDHKVIGIQYIMLALAAVAVGMTMSLLMRLNLSWPGTHWPILETLFPTGAPQGVMTPEFYLSLVTMHGTIMVFFVLTTAPQGGFGNYFLPIQIGAEDMAFPVLNMLSFWVTFVGFIAILLAIFVEGNQGIGEWTIIRGRQRHCWTNRRLDRLRAAERSRQDRRSGPGRRYEPLGHQYRDLLRWFAAGRVELHYDLAEHAYQGHVVDAHAAHLLGVVYDRGARLVVIPGAARRRHSVVARSHRWNEFLYSERTLRQRPALGYEPKLPVAHRRFTDPLATPVLVLRPS